MPKGQIKGAVTDVRRLVVDNPDLDKRQVEALCYYIGGATKQAAALKAGYPETSGTAVFRSATVRAALGQIMERLLVYELSPMAMRALVQILDDPNAAPGVRVTAALGVLDRAGFDAKRFQRQHESEKDISQQSSEELRQSIEKLQSEIDGRMRDITPNDAPDEAQDVDLYP